MYVLRKWCAHHVQCESRIPLEICAFQHEVIFYIHTRFNNLFAWRSVMKSTILLKILSHTHTPVSLFNNKCGLCAGRFYCIMHMHTCMRAQAYTEKIADSTISNQFPRQMANQEFCIKFQILLEVHDKYISWQLSIQMCINAYEHTGDTSEVKSWKHLRMAMAFIWCQVLSFNGCWFGNYPIIIFFSPFVLC